MRLNGREHRIWEYGDEISNGFGFWGTMKHFPERQRATMVKAWIDGLRAKGYTDTEIVFYGDWVDGRHIADEMSFGKSYKDWVETVIRNADDNKDLHVFDESVDHYGADYLRIARALGEGPED